MVGKALNITSETSDKKYSFSCPQCLLTFYCNVQNEANSFSNEVLHALQRWALASILLLNSANRKSANFLGGPAANRESANFHDKSANRKSVTKKYCTALSQKSKQSQKPSSLNDFFYFVHI